METFRKVLSLIILFAGAYAILNDHLVVSIALCLLWMLILFRREIKNSPVN